MKPLDLREWLEKEALFDGDDGGADFAREALELVDAVPYYDECIEIREALEKEAGDEKPKDIVEYFIDRSQLLDELKGTLEKAGFTGDVDDALSNVLAELDDLRTQLAIAENEDASRETLEYDL